MLAAAVQEQERLKKEVRCLEAGTRTLKTRNQGIKTPFNPFGTTVDDSDPSTEIDPKGLLPDMPGAKLDKGKPKAGQILGMFARALWEVAKVGTFGADKYSMGGWQHVEDGQNRYNDAGMRHWLKNAMGEKIDGDSELLHLSQEAWNSLAKLELYLREEEKRND